MGEDNKYKKLFREAINQLCKEREEHKNERIEALISKVEVSPLKPDSVYVVKFNYDIDPIELGRFMERLNSSTSFKNIVFIPSCKMIEIIGDVESYE